MKDYTVLLIQSGSRDVEWEALDSQKTGSPRIIVKTAEDGEEALSLLGLKEGAAYSNPDTFDLVVSDLRTRKRGGAEVLARVRQTDFYATLPYVIWTDSLDPYDVEGCLELGATAVRSMPSEQSVAVKELTWLVREMLQVGRETPASKISML